MIKKNYLQKIRYVENINEDDETDKVEEDEEQKDEDKDGINKKLYLD